MFIRISNWFTQQSTTRNTLFMAILWLGFMAGVMPIAQQYIEKAAGHPVKIIDLQVGKPASVIGELLESYGPDGRERYARIEMTADVIYPVIYTLFFGLLLSWVLRRFFPKYTWLNLLVLIPFVFDLLENACIVWMARSYPNVSHGMMQRCSVLTHLKFGALIPVVVLILVGAIWGWIQKSNNRIKPQ